MISDMTPAAVLAKFGSPPPGVYLNPPLLRSWQEITY
tara:strand:+ start:726 stop:836 length:111 start_codon:yes stop_codon:yes gene_type:complete